MLTSGTKPPSGVKESCIAFTAPHDADVVIEAKSAESAGPKRVSFPSMLFADVSAPTAMAVISRKRIDIAAKTAQPWRGFPVIEPRVYVSPAGIQRMRNIWKKFVNGVGFS